MEHTVISTKKPSFKLGHLRSNLSIRFEKNSGKWHVLINDNGSERTLGPFASEQEARDAFTAHKRETGLVMASRFHCAG